MKLFKRGFVKRGVVEIGIVHEGSYAIGVL